MTIKILGTGCANCKTLERRAREASEGLGADVTIEKVEDLQRIMSYGIMSTPGLVIDEKVVSQGRVLSVEAIKRLMEEAHS
ncbi:MAG: thioredoxin family protein [Bacteroidota bacterium]